MEGGEADDGDDVGGVGPAGGLEPVEEPAKHKIWTESCTLCRSHKHASFKSQWFNRLVIKARCTCMYIPYEEATAYKKKSTSIQAMHIATSDC